MKKLLFLLVLAVAAWQGWKHYHDLVRRPPYHEAVVRNRLKQPIERLRLGVGNQTFVRESLASGEATVFPFRVANQAAAIPAITSATRTTSHGQRSRSGGGSSSGGPCSGGAGSRTSTVMSPSLREPGTAGPC